MKAIDIDEGTSAQIEFSVYETQTSGVKQLFGINRHTGALFLLKSAVPYGKFYSKVVLHFFENQK